MALTPDEEARLVAAEQKAAFAESTLNLLLANGLDDMVSGSGRLYFGGKIMRLDKHGIQIAPGYTQLPAIHFVRQLTNTPSDSAPRGFVSAAVSDEEFARFTTMWMTAIDGDTYSYISPQVDTSGFKVARLDLLVAIPTSPQPHGAIISESLNGAMFQVQNGTCFVLSGEATDFPTPDDGSIWYRTDLDRFRGQVNGTTKNFLLEGDVGGSMKTSGGGYYLIPAGPSGGQTVSSSASADTYGSWVQLRSASGNALYITGVSIYPANANGARYVQLDIGVGGASAEVSIGEWGGAMSRDIQFGSTSYSFPFPIPVAANTRIACRIADNLASALNHTVTLHVIDQSDLVSM